MAQVLCKVFSFVLVILLGVVTARSGKLGKGADRLISKIVFNLTLPCAIIRAFESYDFNVSLLGLVGLGFAATVIPYFLSLFVYRNKPQQERIVQQLSVCGFNIGCFALAFVQAFFPAGCVVATCLFDAGNSLMGTGGTYALTQTLVLGNDDQARGQKLKTFCKTLFSSMAFDSYIVLIAMGLLGLKIPAEVITLIDPIANANAFLAMFMVGLMIRFSLTGKKVKELVRLLSWRVIFAIILSIIALKVLPFDPEVYQGFVDQEATFSDSILASGILASDQSLAASLDNGGTMGTIRFYNPLDPDTDAPLVRDGTTDNVPTEISGGKQSWIRIDRMKAWKATELTRELTAADPMAAVARNTGRYWRMYKQSLLVKLVDSVLGLSGLANHTLTVKTGGVTANQLIDVQQSALGDFSGKFGLLVVHSKILAEYKKMGLLNYNKYVITNVLQKEVSLPTINGLVVVENDRGTDDGTNYNSFLLGQGSVLTADPKVITPDYTEYDAAKAGGTDILYNNRSFILHPNGVSFDGDKINKPTPTDDEFTNKANWALKFDHKNVRMGKITIPKANFVEE